MQLQQHILKNYQVKKKLGSGAYGHVFKVLCKSDDKIYALKKIFDAFQHSTDAQRTYRQIMFLRKLQHPNIIKLYKTIKSYNQQDIYMILEFMQSDLHKVIRQQKLKRINILQQSHKKFIIYQLAKALIYLHSAQLIHRDLKPSNILINSDCIIKLCDFGLVRSISKIETIPIMTQNIATRWYRAPEVLMGSKSYDVSADMWSVGCIIAQMYLGKPIFPGSSTYNQIQRILQFTGFPKTDDLYSFSSMIVSKTIQSMEHQISKHKIKIQAPEPIHRIIGSLLKLNPQKRLSAKELIKSSYLSQFYNREDQNECAQAITLDIDDNYKLNLKQYRKMLFDQDQTVNKKSRKHLRLENIEKDRIVSIEKNQKKFNRVQTFQEGQRAEHIKNMLEKQKKRIGQLRSTSKKQLNKYNKSTHIQFMQPGYLVRNLTYQKLLQQRAFKNYVRNGSLMNR